jgi:hypothetical protein
VGSEICPSVGANWPLPPEPPEPPATITAVLLGALLVPTSTTDAAPPEPP